MRKNRQVKLVAILTIFVSILGLTLGFAAFSNVLTISSSATVTPNSSDFKLVIYGAADANNIGDIDKTITSLTESDPYSDPPRETKKAIINNETLTISNLDVTFKEPGDYFAYYFKIKNEGKYDAYITKSDFEKILNISNTKTCVAAAGTTETMVQDACEFIEVSANLYDYSTYGVINSESLLQSDDYVKIPVGSYASLVVEFNYRGKDVVRADGEFIVNFDDIKLNFSTVNPAQ